MKKPTPCPHCKETTGIYRKVRVSGWADEYLWGDGKTEMQTDNVVYSNDVKRVRCLECNRIRTDVTWSELEN